MGAQKHTRSFPRCISSYNIVLQLAEHGDAFCKSIFQSLHNAKTCSLRQQQHKKCTCVRQLSCSNGSLIMGDVKGHRCAAASTPTTAERSSLPAAQNDARQATEVAATPLSSSYWKGRSENPGASQQLAATPKRPLAPKSGSASKSICSSNLKPSIAYRKNHHKVLLVLVHFLRLPMNAIIPRQTI